MIGRSGERGSGISMPVARHDDDEDFFTSDKTLNFAFVFSILIIFVEQFITVYPWDTIKQKKQDLSKVIMEKRISTKRN